MPGFKGRSGRTFRAKLKLEQTDEGKWRVDFDEEWAKEPPEDREDATARRGRTPAAGNGAAASSALMLPHQSVRAFR